MDTLPPELLWEIVEALEVHTADQPEARIFSSVCRAFRRVVVNTPSLWNLFLISVGGSSASENCTKWVDLKLERSKPSPIQLAISLETGATRESFVEQLSPLLKHCERWEELEIRNVPSVFMDLLQPVKGRLSSLRRLSFWAPSGWDCTIPPFLEGLPLLDEASFMPIPSRFSVLPLRHIRFCTIAVPHHTRAVNVQPNAPLLSALLNPAAQLQELILFLSIEAPNDWDCGPLEAPQLLCLTFQDTRPAGTVWAGADNCTKLLGLLTASSLQELTVCSQLIQPSSLLQFAERSNFKLQYLNLDETTLDEDVMRMLSMQPTLTHLKIGVHNLMDLQPFPKFKDASFLPNLRTWELYVLPLIRPTHDENEDAWKEPIPIAGEVGLLDAIGIARCELAPDSQPTRTSVPSFTRRRLENFEIHCPEDEEFLKGRALIFARTMSAGEGGLDPTLLKYLKGCSVGFATFRRVALGHIPQYERTQEIIASVLPSLLNLRPATLSTSRTVTDDVQYLYVSQLLSSVVRTITDLRDSRTVQHSGFHTTLACAIRSLSPHGRNPELKDKLSFDAFPGMEKQATRLLKSLVPLLKEDVPRLRWRYNAASCSLIYTPNDHGMHATVYRSV